jgi:hypothetical protein
LVQITELLQNDWRAMLSGDDRCEKHRDLEMGKIAVAQAVHVRRNSRLRCQ